MFSPIVDKKLYRNFYLKAMHFKMANLIGKYLGYFYKKICCQYHFKIVQFGLTFWYWKA